MSQNQKPNQRRKIEAKPEHVIIVNEPMVRNPHPRARVKTLDVSKAEKMPGVAYILTPQNAPKTYPLPDELSSREKSSPLLLRSYLSYRLPTIMEVPKEQTNVFINSLETRWFFGSKGFAETAIGAPPRRPRKRHLQCVRRPYPRASHHEREDSGRLESA